MSLAAAFVSGVLFLVAFFALRLVPISLSTVAVLRGALQVLRDSQETDDAKERAMRQSTVRLLSVLAAIAWRLLLAFLLAAVPLVVADLLGLAPWQESASALERWEMIVALCLVGIALCYGWARTWSKT